MVSLKPMTRQMCHAFYQNFQNDPAIGHYYEYVYTPEIADRYFDSNSVADRKLFAIMVGDKIVGECKLKNIDLRKRECTMGIHLQNDLAINSVTLLMLALSVEKKFDIRFESVGPSQLQTLGDVCDYIETRLGK